MITLMTPDTPVPAVLPDLRAVRLDQTLTPATLDKVARRVLPDRPVRTIRPGAAFSSGI